MIVYWGPDEKDLVARQSDWSLSGMILSPPLGVREMAAQLELCDVFVGNDTGPMHLALAVGTPTVAIFLKPNFVRYGPRGAGNISVHRPGGRVSIEEVHEAVRKLLGR